MKLTNISLNDDFTVISNSENWTNTYHKFELNISQADKERIVQQIKSSDQFFVDNKNNFYLPDKAQAYSDTTIFASYENSLYFRQENYTLSEGYASSFIVISIDKNQNILIFEQSSK